MNLAHQPGLSPAPTFPSTRPAPLAKNLVKFLATPKCSGFPQGNLGFPGNTLKIGLILYCLFCKSKLHLWPLPSGLPGEFLHREIRWLGAGGLPGL